MINPPELTTDDEARNDAHIARLVCGSISAHPGLPHQKTKRKTNDASKIS